MYVQSRQWNENKVNLCDSLCTSNVPVSLAVSEKSSPSEPTFLASGDCGGWDGGGCGCSCCCSCCCGISSATTTAAGSASTAAAADDDDGADAAAAVGGGDGGDDDSCTVDISSFDNVKWF